MAGYNSTRRGVNVAHFLANGNTISSPSDVSEDPGFNFDEDLARYTNLDFTEHDQNADLFGTERLELTPDEPAKRQKTDDGDKGLDFVNGEFHFPGPNPFDLSSNQSSLLPDFSTTATGLPPPTASAAYTSYPQPSTFPPQQYPQPHNPEDNNPTARLAAEEDKRRRNTAASARFRVKKKQREQALEKTAEELKIKAQELEQRVGQLQRENEWLKGLVVVKGGSGEGGDGLGKRKRDADSEGGKKGVGTERRLDEEMEAKREFEARSEAV